MGRWTKKSKDNEILDAPNTVTTRLKCGVCGHVARYNVGRVYIDPEIVGTKRSLEEGLSFTGYFRCRKCSSAGPWKPTADTYLAISALMLAREAGEENHRLEFAKPVLLDGTDFLSAAQAEDHLKSLIERDLENAELWRRLGNIYRHAGLTPKARNAFVTSIKLNPDDLESRYNLGDIYFEARKFELAQEQLHKVLILAYENRQMSEDKLRAMVSDTVDMLLEMSHLTDGKIAPFPEFPSKKPSPSKEPVVVYMTDFELSNEADWERMVDMLIGKRKGPDVLRTPPTGISRNQPCPCGSGKKYKRCCGR